MASLRASKGYYSARSSWLRSGAHVTEAALEMHYFHATVACLKAVYKHEEFFRLIKPSTRREAWVGFDQAWVRTTMTHDQFLEDLARAIQQERSKVDRFYIGYFLQVKRVNWIKGRSKYLPKSYDLPYLRAELSLERREPTGLSQHQVLQRLSNIDFASAAYACPMLFKRAEVQKEADLDRLRCVDVRTCPEQFVHEGRQFINFQTTTDPSPCWDRGEAIGVAMGLTDWVDPECEFGPRRLSPAGVKELIVTAAEEVRSLQLFPEPGLMRNLPESLTIVELKSSAKARRGLRDRKEHG